MKAAQTSWFWHVLTVPAVCLVVALLSSCSGPSRDIAPQRARRNTQDHAVPTDEKARSDTPFDFPILPPIANANPASRHRETHKVPTQMLIERTDDRVSVQIDSNSSETIILEVGENMVVGTEHEITVYRDGQEVASGGLGLENGDPGNWTTSLNRIHDGIPVPGEQYVLEICFVVFETDLLPQHAWIPKNGRYKQLWTRTIRQDF